MPDPPAMDFYPPDRALPGGLVSDEFVLEPLTAAHVELDYAALMDSTEMLHTWSGTPWPAEGFSLDDNRQDLERHDREHQDRVAFTFTVLDPDRTECLGCVYVIPLATLEQHNPALPKVGSDAAVATFWVRSTKLADHLDVRLLAALRAWFETDWSFSSVTFATNSANPQQLGILDRSGLQRGHSVVVPPHSGRFVLFSEAPLPH